MANTDFLQGDNTIPWQEKLKKYAQDRNAGQSEYARAGQVYNYKNSLGDTAGAEAAKKWMGQIDTATGGLMSRPTAKPVDDVMEKYNNFLTQSMQRKPFDPNTDQQYQTQLAAARQNVMQGAQTATNNAMVGLGARGIGNSSVAVDRANQIGQQANARLQTEITPQIMQQAYQRYMAEQQLAQQDLSNLGGLVDRTNNQYQQGLDNQYRDRTFDRQVNRDNIADQRYTDETAYSRGRDNIADQRYSDETSYSRGRDTLGDQRWNQEFALEQNYKNASMANMAADNARLSVPKETKAQTPGDANEYVSNLNKRYLGEDEDGNVLVKDPGGLERAILSLNLSPDQTEYLYRYYGLQIPE